MHIKITYLLNTFVRRTIVMEPFSHWRVEMSIQSQAPTQAKAFLWRITYISGSENWEPRIPTFPKLFLNPICNGPPASIQHIGLSLCNKYLQFSETSPMRLSLGPFPASHSQVRNSNPCCCYYGICPEVSKTLK